MKKVIAGALYNTDTAKEIGSWEPNGYDHNNFSYFCERLYRTKSGKYYIHGAGHAQSPYGVWRGNSGGWGEDIRPMSFVDAREWAEEHLDGDEYAAEFGEPEEASEGKVLLTLSVLPEVKAKLERIKAQTGKSMSVLVSNAIAKGDGNFF